MALNVNHTLEGAAYKRAVIGRRHYLLPWYVLRSGLRYELSTDRMINSMR